MSGLPRQLRPWAKTLSIFPPEMALVLGELAARIANVVGTRELEQDAQGDPDGFGGLSRRGTYDRLLATEWMIHQEFPEEFMRRVVSGEHTFLERVYRRNSAIRNCLVLFDSGPEQLGTPRVAQLATLIVLSQRAEAAKAKFQWGVLQAPTTTSHENLTQASVQDFLRTKSTALVTEADFERWNDWLRTEESSELWLVGPHSLSKEAEKRKASLLVIAEVLELGDKQTLNVTAQTAQSTRVQHAVLELPSQPVAVQILRDPFASAVATRRVSTQNTSIDPTSNIVFSVDGRRLFALGTNGQLIILQLPNSPRAKTGPPVSFVPSDGHRILAVGQTRSRKRSIVVTEAGGDLFLHTLSKRGTIANQTVRHACPKGYPRRSEQRLHSLGVAAANQACFADDDGKLVVFYNGQLLISDQHAVASKALLTGLLYLSANESIPRAMQTKFSPSDGLKLDLVPVGLSLAKRKSPFYFGPHESTSAIAFERDDNTWVSVKNGKPTFFEIPSQHTVVGVIERSGVPAGEQLVVLSPSRKSLQLWGPTESSTILTTTSRITYAAASTTSRDIAYITKTGELGVYCRHAETIVLRVESACQGLAHNGNAQ